MEKKMETIIWGLGFRDVTRTMENQMGNWAAVKELKLILLLGEPYSLLYTCPVR